MNFFSETLEEIMGFYSPGRTATITAIPPFPSESTYVHEMAHRRLCDNTSFGKLTQLISLAWRQELWNSEDSALGNILSECIENSWICHEGYAVWQQFAHALVSADSCTWEVVERALPVRYRTAAAGFAINPRILLTCVAADYTIDQRRHLLAALIEVASTGIAYGAMATPLVAQLKRGGQLTPIDVVLALRADPPDVRLRKLAQAATPEKVVAWFRQVAAVLRPGTSFRRHVEAWDKIAEEACNDAGLAFEAADEVMNSAGEIMGSLGMSCTIEFHEPASETIEENRDRTSASHAVSRISIPIVKRSSLPEVVDVIVKWREFVSTVGFGSTVGDFGVVAELLGEMDGETRGLIHCYTRYVAPPEDGRMRIPRPFLEQFQRLQLDLDELIRRLRPNSALHLGAIEFQLPTSEIYLLSGLSSCRFTWVLLSLSLAQYDLARLAAHGPLHVVDPVNEDWLRQPHSECIEATCCSWSSALFQKLYLHHYDFDAAHGATYARVGPDEVPKYGLVKRRATFLEACLVDTLLVGAFAQFQGSESS